MDDHHSELRRGEAGMALYPSPPLIRSGMGKEVLHILNIMKVFLVRYIPLYLLESVHVAYKIY